MNKKIFDNRRNNETFIIQSSSHNDNNSKCKTLETTINNDETTNNKENTAFDYKNIPLTLTGEVSSPWIHRDKLMTQNYLHKSSFTENNDIEDDDEQFFLNLRKIIDKSDIREDRRNNSIKDLQSKSYSSKKKRSLFSDEDENVMKRFKKSLEEKKSSGTEVSGEKLQKNSENQIHFIDNNKNRSATPSTVVFESISPTITISSGMNNMNMSTQRNDKFSTSENTKIIFEVTEDDEFPEFTPPRPDE